MRWEEVVPFHLAGIHQELLVRPASPGDTAGAPHELIIHLIEGQAGHEAGDDASAPVLAPRGAP